MKKTGPAGPVFVVPFATGREALVTSWRPWKPELQPVPEPQQAQQQEQLREQSRPSAHQQQEQRPERQQAPVQERVPGAVSPLSCCRQREGRQRGRQQRVNVSLKHFLIRS